MGRNLAAAAACLRLWVERGKVVVAVERQRLAIEHHAPATQLRRRQQVPESAQGRE